MQGAMGTVLRDYQLSMLRDLGEAWRRSRSVLVQMPTGTGKTRLMAEVIRRLGQPSGGVLVVAHRRELIDQISQTLSSCGIAHGLTLGGRAPCTSGFVQVASIQTLSRRLGASGSGGCGLCPSLVIVDEAHHALARTYRVLWDRWPEARFLGLTATPCRLGGAPLTDLFDVLLQSWPIQDFIDRGWLSDFDYVSAAPGSAALLRVGQLRRRGPDGDYQPRELSAVMDVPESVAHLYATYARYARGLKGIVYAIDRSHAQHISEYYASHGVSCAVIDATTPPAERQRLVEAYRAGRSVLVNVDIFSEGFDCPEVEFIQLARPTLSLSKYLQQVGRGMRPSPGKDHVLVLDQVGLYQTFGLPTDARDWQSFFEGRAAGRGQGVRSMPVILRDGGDGGRELVNLEMVRIRCRSDKPLGLGIYLQDGRYGVVRDGTPVTPAVFERVERCRDGEPFYAYGVYPYQLYQNRKTVIGSDGTDQCVRLYGELRFRGEFLYGHDLLGNTLIWDSVGRRTYRGSVPRFENVGGLEVIRTAGGEYELRSPVGVRLQRFRRGEVIYNQHIAIIRNCLFLKSDHNRLYTIFAYKDDYVMAYGKNRNTYIPITWDGRVGQPQDYYPKDFKPYPNVALMHLKVGGGKPGYA